ncbi:glycosyltransferase [Lactobacillus sp. PV037]|uniref:glycosyltransferase n=1 Tax=Lactobacillus sp. PV037 TaxID=2594496 RepID=UPI00223FD414|nr:glycosyltransferase [Lactobacillus sp. PV037]QNQ83111.1 glycosyltransferase [Lactobacillus sp. PV037]
MPKISVLMSTFNCQNYSQIYNSVQSILDQTFKDWELIIYNDGSTDNGKTSQYINQLANLDVRIQVIESSHNHGLAYAKNQMIKVAKGDYITAQDDDDISEVTRLEREVDFLDKNTKYDFVGTTATVFDKDGRWGEYKTPEIPTKDSFLWSNPYIHPSVMFRKKTLKQVKGYRVAKETMRGEDYDLFLRLYAGGYKGYNIQDNLYKYYIDRNPYKKYRPMKDRINEAKLRYKGFKSLGYGFKGLPYIVKPILIGLIPNKIFRKIRERQYRKDR